MKFIPTPFLLLLLASPQSAPPLTVFAAASLTEAISDAAARYEAAGGRKLRLAFAASSTLARQIEAGADAALYLSADETWMDYLAARGLVVTSTRRPLLGNRLALVVGAGNPQTLDLSRPFDLSALLRGGRLAMGDPAHVPAGRYAREALTNLGLWESARTRLAAAESVRAALALVERGEVEAAVVYETDARASTKVRVAGLFPATLHSPIVYAVAIVSGHDSPAARAAYEYVIGPDAARVFRARGFQTR